MRLKDRKTDNSIHIKEAMRWLCHAQDVAQDGGVAGWYSFVKGWSPSYPETTGYIIPTFFDYFHREGTGDCKDRAFRMADWLLSVQLHNGAFQCHHVGIKAEPRVFNTGQVLFGLVRAFRESKDVRYLEAAKNAVDFLVQTQDDDGAWRKYAFNSIPHTYYTRVAWGVLELNNIEPDERYVTCVRKNLDWALSQKQESGWYDNTAFEKNKNPFTHTIAYFIEGLLDSGIILKEEKYIGSALDISERLMRSFEVRKFMPGEFDSDWRGNFKYSCLTGDAQMSIIWQKIYKLNGDARFLNAALKINDYLRSRQWLASPFKAMKGGIQGSDPTWGGYHPFWMPSWATKFFVDALLLEEEIMSKLEKNT
jgi:hypothetical protein